LTGASVYASAVVLVVLGGSCCGVVCSCEVGRYVVVGCIGTAAGACRLGVCVSALLLAFVVSGRSCSHQDRSCVYHDRQMWLGIFMTVK
jgi:hypothetical protein